MTSIHFKSSLIAAILLSLINIQGLFAETFVKDGFQYKTVSPELVRITGYQYDSISATETFYVPASVEYNEKTYRVECVRCNAFEGLTFIRTVVVNEGIEIIDDGAFRNCVNLQSIHIPSSVETIGVELFTGCYSLKEILVNPDNEYFDSRDGCNAIINTDENTLLVGCQTTQIPASVIAIGANAFLHCYGLEQLVVPEGVERIEHSAFLGCRNLRKISLPLSLRSIGRCVFESCSSLDSLFIPKNVTSIEDAGLFESCNNLSSIIVDEENPIYDSRSNCNAIVRKSDSALIAACAATVIVDGISSIEWQSFCRLNIHSVDLPASVTKIEFEAFYFCNEIESVTVDSLNPVYSSPQGSNAILSKDGKTLVFGCRTTVIPDGVENIGDYAFSGGRMSRYFLQLPEGLKTIGESAFQCCYGIRELVIPQSVVSIGWNAFYKCVNLNTVQMLCPLQEIKNETFAECISLETINIPDSVKTISDRAFSHCHRLKSLILPSSIEYIEQDAVQNTPCRIIIR